MTPRQGEISCPAGRPDPAGLIQQTKSSGRAERFAEIYYRVEYILPDCANAIY
jgi:hypothetical protein